MEKKEEIGRRLKQSRKYAGLTQKQVAEHLGMQQSAYARYESGIYELDYDKMIILCKLFEITSDYLLGLED